MGIEINNVARSRLEIMLHLEIQKGKEATKTSEFKNILELILRALRDDR